MICTSLFKFKLLRQNLEFSNWISYIVCKKNIDFDTKNEKDIQYLFKGIQCMNSFI